MRRLAYSAIAMSISFSAFAQGIDTPAITAPAAPSQPGAAADLNLFGPPTATPQATPSRPAQRQQERRDQDRGQEGQPAPVAALPTPVPQTGEADVAVRDKNWDKPVAAPHQYAPGAARYDYREGITIHIRLGAPCLLVFPPWVNIVQPPTPGMPWVKAYRPAPNVVGLQALKGDKDLNLQLITNDGIFSFNLRTYTYESAPFITDSKVDITVPRDGRVGPASAPEATGTFMPADNGGGAASPTKYYSMLPDYARRFILDASRVTIPHQPEEHAEGDWGAIGPQRIWEDSYRTYFDFGPDNRLKPRPQFYKLVDGIERPATPLVLDQKNGLVAVYGIGDFVLRYDQHIICVIRTEDPEAGIKGSAARPMK